ncbi:hypothetical protein OAL67_00055 [bacterium]|nr:hypothetical protein [bacterium]
MKYTCVASFVRKKGTDATKNVRDKNLGPGTVFENARSEKMHLYAVGDSLDGEVAAKVNAEDVDDFWPREVYNFQFFLLTEARVQELEDLELPNGEDEE